MPHKIKSKDIDKQLKFRGNVFRFFIPKFTPKLLKLGNKLSSIAFSGKSRTRKLRYQQEYITREDGSKLRIVIYSNKTPKENAVGVLWIHGGGYAVGAPEQDVSFAEHFIKAHNCVVICPDYRLSIGDPYPLGFQDCVSTLEWLKSNAEKLGINPRQIFVGGESAGGGLSVALCLYARDNNLAKIAFQMPIYPMMNNEDTPSSCDNDAPFWNTASNHLAWQLYLRNLDGNDIPKYAVPAKEVDYSHLPPAVTYFGDLEPFHDEILDYIENLKNAGVKVEYQIFKGCYHGFDIIAPRSEVAIDAKAFLVKNFLYACENYFTD